MDACGKVRGTADFGAVNAVEDLAEVGSEGDKDFGTFAAHRHKADRGFGVGLGFGGED